jgi:hypothetical protein
MGYASYLEDVGDMQQELTTLGETLRQWVPKIESTGVRSCTNRRRPLITHCRTIEAARAIILELEAKRPSSRPIR